MNLLEEIPSKEIGWTNLLGEIPSKEIGWRNLLWGTPSKRIGWTNLLWGNSFKRDRLEESTRGNKTSQREPHLSFILDS